jgi:probable HAF family extracellular repeat protein
MKAARVILAAVGLVSLLIANAMAARSITYVIGTWQITLTDLGLLPGGTASRALAINTAGNVAGLATDSTFALQRPIWDANTGAIIRTADNLDPASTAVPEHINDIGEMVGTEEFGGRLYRGVYWNPQGRAFGLRPLPGVDPVFGPVHVKGHGINNLGQMVGASQESAPNFFLHAVLWQNKDTSPQDLGFLGTGTYGNDSEAYGINDLTHIVGNSAVGTAIRAFLWRNGRMIDLGALSGQVVSEAIAINNSGLVVGKSNFYPVAWRYDVANATSTAAIQQLPIPAGFFSAQPAAVNDSGDVAGYAGSPSIDAHAVLWRNGRAIDLGVWPGGHYSVATGINNFGQIVGTGTVAGDNLDHALMWTVEATGGGATNATPAADLIAMSSTSIRVGRSLSVQASFTDPDNGPWSYKLTWGDGTDTTGTMSNAGAIPGISPHAYRRAGTFNARLTVTDGRGATGGSKTITVRVR